MKRTYLRPLVALAVLIAAQSGCINTTVTRTGRVLEPYAYRINVALGPQFALEPLAEYTTGKPETGPAGFPTRPLEVHTAPVEDFAMQGVVGPRIGLPYGFEVGAALSMPGAFGGALFARKSVVDTGGFALAASLDASRGWFGQDGASVGMWSARARLDASFHHRWFAVYGSPSIGMIGVSKTELGGKMGGDYSGSAVVEVVGGTVGVRVGEDWGVYAEVGQLWDLGDSGGSILVPALGFEYRGEGNDDDA